MTFNSLYCIPKPVELEVIEEQDRETFNSLYCIQRVLLEKFSLYLRPELSILYIVFSP